MTEKQKEFIQDLYEILESAHRDMRTGYPMTIRSSEGEHEEIYNREGYLEFIVAVAVEQIGEAFEDLIDED